MQEGEIKDSSVFAPRTEGLCAARSHCALSHQPRRASSLASGSETGLSLLKKKTDKQSDYTIQT